MIDGAATPKPAAAFGRMLELDAFRGIAALGVVAWHYRWHFGAMPFPTLLQPFYNAGFLLVDFFFVLSGYVIARAYWQEPRQWRFGANVRARISRLYPLHLLTLVATALLIAALPPGADDPEFVRASDDARHFALNLLLLNQSGLQRDWSFNTPAWSISAEFLANVAFLASISLGVRSRLSLFALMVAIGVFLVAYGPRPIIGERYAFTFIDLNLLRCFLSFAAGVGAQASLDRFGGRHVLASLPRVTPWLAAAFLAALLAILSHSTRHPPVWHYLASTLASAGCVIFVPFGGALKRALVVRPLIFLGEISYSLYLIHYPLQLALYLASEKGLFRADYSSPLVFLAFFALSIGVSAATHYVVEKPAQRWLLDRMPPKSQSSTLPT